MTNRSVMLTIISVCFLLISAPIYAGGDKAAIDSMSNIMLHLNHYPSDSEKQQLSKFISDKSLSKNVRTMAQAMNNLEHKAIDSDKAKLSVIVSDQSASENERTLASVIQDLNHSPSDSDKQKLKKLLE